MTSGRLVMDRKTDISSASTSVCYMHNNNKGIINKSTMIININMSMSNSPILLPFILILSRFIHAIAKSLAVLNSTVNASLQMCTVMDAIV